MSTLDPLTLLARVQTLSQKSLATITILVLSNLFFNVLANASFKVSAGSQTVQGFWIWQIVGNLAGLVTVITLTFMLRIIPLYVAIPLTMGLTVIGVQIFAARMLFDEPVTPIKWAGTLLILLGILLVGGPKN